MITAVSSTVADGIHRHAHAGRRIRHWAAVLLAACMAQCGDSPTDPLNAGLLVLAGSTQSAEAGAELTEPIVIEVRDPLTGAASGVRLRAQPSAGGQVTPAEAVTDGNGRASFRWTLANTVGEQTLTIEKTTGGEQITIRATALIASIATVAVTPAPAELVQNLTQQFSVTLRDARGATLTGRSVVWSSSNTAVATVNASTGVATAITVGATDIVATSESRTGSARLTVVATQPTQLAVTTQPGGAVTALPFTVQPSVEVRDGTGTRVAGSAAVVTASIASGSGVLSGTTTVGAVNGVATFTDLRITGGGEHTLRFVSGALNAAVSAPFQVVTVTVATTSLPNATRGVGYSHQLSATGGTGVNTWTVIAGAPPAGVTLDPSGLLSGTPTTAGAANFTVRVSSGGATDSRALTLTVVEPQGAAGTLVFTQYPVAGATAGAPLGTVVVTARNDVGETIASFNGNVTLTVSGIPPGATLTGTATVAAVAGVATFNDLSIAIAGSHRLTATGSGATPPAVAIGADFVITAGAPAQVAIASGNAQTGTAGADLALPIVARVSDAFGNAVSNVSVAFAVATGGGSVTNPNALTGGTGLAQTSWRLGAAVGAQTATATVVGLTPVTFTATASAATQPSLAVLTQPAGAVSGAAFTTQPVVEVRDAGGARITTSTAAVTATLTSGTGALLGTVTVNAVAGVATFTNLRIDLSGDKQLTFAATGVTSALSGSFAVQPGAAVLLAVTREPAGATSGAAFTTQPIVQVRDAAGNVVTSSVAAINVTLTGGTGVLLGTTSVNAVAGVATFTDLRIDAAGNKQLAFAATGLTGATSATFAVAPGAAALLAIVTEPAGATSGATFVTQPVVQIRDAAGNLVTGATAAVTATLSSGTGVLLGTVNVNAVGGVATFTDLRIDATGSKQLTFNSSGLTAAVSAAFTVAAGAATQLAFTVQPSAVNVGASIAPAIAVTARDAAGNTATTFTGNVTLSVGTNPGGGALGGTLTVAAVAGVATFGNITVSAAGVGYTLLAGASGVTGATSSAFTVSAVGGGATQLAFTVQPSSVSAGAPITPAVVVSARDAGGNTAPSFTGNVTLAIGTNPGGGAIGGTVTVAAVDGVATFNNVTISAAGVGYTLVASGGGLTNATSNAFSVTGPAGPATQLAVVTQPAGATAGAVFGTQPVVHIRDANGVLVTTSTATVTATLSSGSGTLQGTVSVAAVGGVATFTDLRIDASGLKQLTFASTGLTSAVTSGFVVGVATATQLAFTIQPSGTTPSTPISPAIQVTARDGNGNTVTSYTGSVTLAFGANPGGATLGGTLTVAAVAGIATFSNITVSALGAGYTLVASAAGLANATSAAFTISATSLTNAWINPAGGNWSTGSNWSKGRKPETGDSVVITLPGTYTVTLSETFTASTLEIGGANGTKSLTVSSALTVNVSLVVYAGGVLTTASTVSGAGFIVNQGTYNLSSTVSVPISNEGILVMAGTLSGDLITSPGSKVQVDGQSSLPGFTNNGELYLGTHLTVAGTLTNAAGGMITMQADNGSRQVGTTSFVNSGTVAATANLVLTGTPVTNNGAIAVSASRTVSMNATAFTHAAGATISGAGKLTLSSAGTSATLTGAITIAVLEIGPFQTLTFSSALITGGTTYVIGAQSLVVPSVTVSAGSTLQLAGVTTSAPITNNGTLELRESSTLNGALTTSQTSVINVAAGLGSGTHASITVAAGFTNNGALNLTEVPEGSESSAGLTVAGTLVNAVGASISVVQQGTLNVTTLDNRGTFTITSATLSLTGAVQNASTGTIAVTGADLDVFLTSQSVGNNGTISIAPGRRLRVMGSSSTFTHAAGATLNGGGRLHLEVAATITGSFTLGTIRLETAGAVATFAAAQTSSAVAWEIRTGTVIAPTFTHTVGGSLAITNATFVTNFVNEGSLVVSAEPIYGRSLTITGAFTSTGTINATLAGLVEGNNYDRIAVSGVATVSGTLTVLLDGGFTTSSGQQFNILTAATRLGTFGTTNLIGAMTVQYNLTSVALIVP